VFRLTLIWKTNLEIDAHGLHVSPGFIDIHAHDAAALLYQVISHNKYSLIFLSNS
jgi:N-acyl-D-aspartate/D-glutamate deacylase